MIFGDIASWSDNLHSETFKLKEGTQYRLKFDFYVQREIVTGLKWEKW